jgi:hypothetical protein
MRVSSQMAYRNVLTLNALIELLDKKGILKREEVTQLVKKFQGEINEHLKPQ